ncbi:hypothetical protein ABLU29_00105 (plasmid) [Lactococcus lactis]|uniref:DUF7736 domain-containing protein n=1 Tax=Lactococcus lactis TaxID=1358 RepID=UPI0033142691
MSELKTWENGELIGLLRSEIEYVEDFTDTGRLDDVVEEIEKRLIQDSEMLEKNLGHYEKEFIQKIQAEDIKLVTIDEFKDSNSKILIEHLQGEKLRKRCEKYETALTEITEIDIFSDVIASRAISIADRALTTELGFRFINFFGVPTKRDLAILTAYTGYMFGEFSGFHEYAEEVMGQKIIPPQFGSQRIFEKLHELSKKDFLELHERLIPESEIKDDQ